MDDYLEYLWVNPPRCIKASTTTPDVRLKKALVENYGEYATVFGIRCSCGNRKLGIIGREDLEGIMDVGDPYSIHCGSCMRSILIFNRHDHGYDGELGLVSVQEEDAKELILKCPSCANDCFEIALVFQYTGEETELIETERLAARPEDIFGWFAGQALCVSCGRDFEFSSVECA